MELIDVLHSIMQDSLKASKPTDLCFGTVSSVSPLQVTLEMSMLPIPQEALSLTDSVIARSETVSATTSDGATVTITVPIQKALVAGEKVLMLRCGGGQRFVILSRVY